MMELKQSYKLSLCFRPLVRFFSLVNFANLFSEDILYNVSGTTEISGQWIGKEALFGYLNPYVFEHIDAENSNMSTKYKIMCENKAVKLHVKVEVQSHTRFACFLYSFYLQLRNNISESK